MIETTKKTPVQWAQGLLQTGFVVLDTETTGLLDDRDSEVISLAIVNQEGQVLLDSLVKPVRAIDEQGRAFTVHGITNARMLAVGRPWADVWGEAYPLLCAAPAIVSYNLGFDAPMIAKSCRQHGVVWPGELALFTCAMEWYAEFWGAHDHYGNYKWQSLTNACAQMKIERKPNHTAAGDAVAVVELIKAMAKG